MDDSLLAREAEGQSQGSKPELGRTGHSVDGDWDWVKRRWEVGFGRSAADLLVTWQVSEFVGWSSTPGPLQSLPRLLPAPLPRVSEPCYFPCLLTQGDAAKGR